MKARCQVDAAQLLPHTPMHNDTCWCLVLLAAAAGDASIAMQ
jgi:hypothetical protein